MSSRIYTEGQLTEMVQSKLSHLVQAVDLGIRPDTTILPMIGTFVATARLLYGREAVDEQIAESQAVADAREAGICEQCCEVRVLRGNLICEACRKKEAELLIPADSWA